MSQNSFFDKTMKLKSEVVNAIQLLALLCLLFWSFTWSSYSFPRFATYDSEAVDTSHNSRLNTDITALKNQHSVLVETFSAVKHATKNVASSSSIIQPFKEWKEKEMTKYEKSSNEVIPKSQNKLTRRKLNYASSKCGAKILASNSEAKHRTAILSEKVDEYLLNPCRVQTWFTIELCDTVEATQIELANYELYSSTPKLFTVFWSDLYPTLIWRFLGTFEGKDQRTMQTFDVKVKNLGKFIKVNVYSHYGKEHYCPLSVFRVLGYSMVQEFENIESATLIPASGINPELETELEENASSKKPLNISQTKIKNLENLTSKWYCLEICTPFLNHCIDSVDKISKERCVQKPVCHFFNAILPELKSICTLDVCFIHSKIPTKIDNFTNKAYSKSNVSAYLVEDGNKSKKGSNKRNSNCSEFYETSKNYTVKPSHKMEESTNSSVPPVIENNDVNTSQKISSKAEVPVSENYFINVTEGEEITKPKNNYEHNIEILQKKCDCENNADNTQKLECDASPNKRNVYALPEDGDSVDSAGFLQKESVLLKLTSRIKASELDLDLINKYLQQLSQSYRQQMEDMQTLFNHTVRAISVASEKAAKIDYKQQDDINTLVSRVHTLNRKVDYLMSGQGDIFKRVMELHGFFLLLEIIIISTIFTIFLNIFSRKTSHFFRIENNLRRLSF